MAELSKRQKDLLELAKKGGNDATLFLLNRIEKLEDMWDGLNVNGNDIQVKQVREVRNIEEKGIQDIIISLAKQLVKIQKGEQGIPGRDGYTPQRGVDYFTEEELSEIKEAIRPKKGIDYFDGLNGKDADEEVVTRNAAKSAATILKAMLPDLKEDIRDALEKLKGKERLDVSAIRGLDKRLKKIEDKPLGGGGGGFSKIAMDIHFIEDETPSGTVNGSNTDFVLGHDPNPTSSLKVFVNGMRMRITEDYTLSGRTISFVTAPPTNSIILCDYRI